MKKLSKIIYPIACGFFLLGLNSCSEDYLEVPKYDVLAADQMYKSDADALKGLVGCYDFMLPAGDADGVGGSDADGDWGIKPNLFIGCHPTMDTQATGWDKNWNTQTWDASSAELKNGWLHAYMAIERCNQFLTGLEKADKVSASLKPILEGEARGIRSFFYMWLAKAFGRVPLLSTGENFINTPNKARASNYEEMWNFIIADLEAAVPLLDWDPYNNQKGRVTKGFILSYLGEAYMWKAYKVPESATASYASASAALLQVINSGKYELNPSFTTLWDPGAVWTKEAIWEEVLDQGPNWTSGKDVTDASTWHVFFTACPEAGGWGTLYLSWEWWSCYEPGDKRRDASGITGYIPTLAADHPDWVSKTNYGVNPWTQDSLAAGPKLSTHYHYNMGGEPGPSIWSAKTWRTGRAKWDAPRPAQQIYYKRYANVLLDYAECLFRVNPDDATAWGIVNQIRERGFGNLEVGKAAALTATYNPYYQQLIQFYIDKKVQPGGIKNTFQVVPKEYPIPFNTAVVPVTDAKTYYTELKGTKGFSSPVWLVALGEERRKEFNAEWCLAPDLIRSGYIEDHITHNYPKGVGVPNSDPTVFDNWHTYRSFDFDLKKMDMPIPNEELLKNKLCDQNEAYL